MMNAGIFVSTAIYCQVFQRCFPLLCCLSWQVAQLENMQI